MKLAILLFLLLTQPVSAYRERVTDSGDYVVVALSAGFHMRLVPAGRLVPASSFRGHGQVVVNGQFFDPGTGSLMGTIRCSGSTVSDDGRRNGRGVIWGGGPDWQLTPSGYVHRAENGFQAGPTLVENGRPVDRAEAERVHPNEYGRARRVALARAHDGTTLVVVTRSGYSLHQFAALLAGLGVRDAIGLDGGSSSCLYVRGSELVSADRGLPSALVFDVPSTPAPILVKATPPRETRVAPGAGDVFQVAILAPTAGRAVAVRSDLSLESQIQAQGAALVCSPDLFNPGSPDILGALRSGGRPIGGHSGPSVGYTWAINDGKFIIRRCCGKHLSQGLVGGCGPLLRCDGKAMVLTDQGFTRTGGLFERNRRLAIALDKDGRLHLVGSTAMLTPDEFLTRLDERFRYVIGLSGGDYGVLYDQGRWIMRARANPPYLYVFPTTRSTRFGSR